jgi:5'-phosphate synthase pdxT subunit
MVRIGVLALQGDFAAHATALERSGAEVSEIRRCAELDRIDGLILPGGESTTLLNLMADEPWFDALRSFHARGGWILGTCAGAILLSREVSGPAQASLGLLDAAIERNGFGRQVDSFEIDLDVSGMRFPLRAVFIRAPRFRRLGAAVECLARFRNEPVLVRQGRILAATFHPELTGDDRLHDRFARLVAGVEPVAAAS